MHIQHIPPPPDLRSPRRLALTAFVAALVASVVLAVMNWGELPGALGDTDDATRLVMVRALLAGQGWWDQQMMRFQPPVGVFMHWSRLLDGAIAALDRLFQLALSSDDAEIATRFTWPLLWTFPTGVAALLLARRLGAGVMGGAVVLVCAIILASDISLYAQFRPGRVDHHDVQMSLCMLALAGASLGSPNFRGAVLAGVATGLGLAIGLEALAFEAAIGAAMALRFIVRPSEARGAKAYALALGVATVLAFAVQTPPWRWRLVACDALAFNLVGAVVVAAAGLFAVAALTAQRSPWVRGGALVLVGAAAAAAYLGLDPHCLAGPFADVDPRIKPIWLNYVQEVRPLSKVWKLDPSQGVALATPWVLGTCAWIGLGFRRVRRKQTAWWLSGACLLLAIVHAANAIRYTGYAEWFAVPLVAAAATELARRYERAGVVAVVMAGAVACPMTATGLAMQVTKAIVRKPPPKPVLASAGPPGAEKRAGKTVGRPAARGKPKAAPDRCFDSDEYDALSDAAPAGLVLSEVDLGPFIVANTDHAALAAPYHRMSWGILKAHAILGAPAEGASAALARQARVAYVLECRFHSRHGDRDSQPKGSLQKRLDAGSPPGWLHPLSPKDAPLQVYRVLPG